jgi:endonuclease/exonuclease/phosphatase family metal-dependent hydrolase
MILTEKRRSISRYDSPVRRRLIDHRLRTGYRPFADAPRVLCGDYNAEPMSDEIRMLTGPDGVWASDHFGVLTELDLDALAGQLDPV